MSRSDDVVVSRYYSAGELTPHISMNREVDDLHITAMSSSDTSSDLEWKEFDDSDYENIITSNPSITCNESNIDNDDSAIKATRWTLPGTSLPSLLSSPHPLQDRTSIPVKLTNSMIKSAIDNSNENDSNYIDDDNKSSDLGGIIVTTVKVIEVSVSQLNTHQESTSLTQEQEIISDSPTKITSPLKTSGNSQQIQGVNSHQSNKRHAIINSSKRKNNDDDKIKQRKDSTKGKQRSGIPIKKGKLNQVVTVQDKNNNTSEIPTSKPQNSNVNRTRSTKRTPLKRSQQVVKKGTRRRRQMEYAPTSNPLSSNDPTDMEADLPQIKSQGFPWIPGPIGPPKLIHASLIPLPQHNKKRSTSNQMHKKIPSIQVDKSSRSFLQSFNPKNAFAGLKSESSSSTKKTQQANRASQIFRRQLLEQSLAASFTELVVANAAQQNLNQQRPLIRKRTKKSSNAKLEDREVRRERRRRERGVNKMEANGINNTEVKLENKDGIKSKEVGTGTRSNVTSKKVTSERKESQSSSQPSFRRKTNENITPTDLKLKQKTTSDLSPILCNLPTMAGESMKLTSSEQPPFPTHLSSRKSSEPKRNNFSVGPPPLFLINSATTTPSEELDILKDFIKPTIDNVEKDSENQVTSPIFTSPVVTSPVSSIPVPTTPRSNKRGMSFFGFFNKREQSSQPTSLHGSPTIPLSPRSSTNFSLSPRSSSFSLLPRSPKSPIKSPTSFSFLPRYSRSPSPNPPPSSSSLASHIPITKTPASSRATSPNPLSSRSSSSNPPKSRFTKPNSLKSRSTTPNYPLSPRSPLSPKIPSLPGSPNFPSSSSRPLSPGGSASSGYTRQQTKSPAATENSEKLRKMQKFEEIIAKSEANNKSTRIGKIRSLKTALTTTSTALASPTLIPASSVTGSIKGDYSASSSTISTNTMDINNIVNNSNSKGKEITNDNRDSANSDNYNPDENENIGKSSINKDDVIRVTLTPAVCR
ncbi:15063_t:CDS:2 [Funneliformis caledonium]|uniref:15063_t:CDS:1 n=1 Tax=Funneliformis caledonium TaxID=1117310 RepID=A0A9N8YLD2_9GLOM|nr:15063_t:CDS:2 [Funneliformis caledonium]